MFSSMLERNSEVRDSQPQYWTSPLDVAKSYTWTFNTDPEHKKVITSSLLTLYLCSRDTKPDTHTISPSLSIAAGLFVFNSLLRGGNGDSVTAVIPAWPQRTADQWWHDDCRVQVHVCGFLFVWYVCMCIYICLCMLCMCACVWERGEGKGWMHLMWE